MIIEEVPGCGTVVQPLPSVEMAKFNGKVICGKRAGDSFVNLVRPDNDDGICPEGTSPCSASTSTFNTVCYPEELHVEQCPITEILVVDQATGDQLKSNQSYTVLDYNLNDTQSMYLAYSKNKDNLPITTTFVGTRPC